MKQNIADLEPNQVVLSYFLIVDLPQVRKSKKGTDYACLELIDKTGKVDGRIWEIPTGLDVNSLKKVVVKVFGEVSEWDGKLQVSISKIRPINADDQVDMDDLFERSERDPEEMWQELLGIVHDRVTSWSPVQRLLVNIMVENEKAFKIAPAAKRVHHAYLGGLLEHVLDMCNVALPICANYALDVDLVIAGCVLHDVGKIFELTYDFGIGYSPEGSLLGHVSQGMMLVAKVIDTMEDFPIPTKISILHLIASHHGLLQYGSPKVPLMREAIVLNLVDLMSSKMGICATALKSGTNPEGFTEWIKEFEGPLFVHRVEGATT